MAWGAYPRTFPPAPKFENIQELASCSDLISIDNISTTAGHTIVVNVNLKNEASDYTAYQFDVVLPEGFNIARKTNGRLDITKGDRYADNSHSLTVENVDYLKYRFVCISTNNSLITGNDGSILSFSLHASRSLASGDYVGRIENVVITHSDEKKDILASNKINVTASEIDFTPGDANGDNVIDVVDPVAIVNYILNKPSDTFVVEAADINDDGEIDVFDVTKVINIILSTPSNSGAGGKVRG